MKWIIPWLLVGWLTCEAWSQSGYFQQDVNYRIRVELDDRQHVLRGSIDIDYTNRAPHSLDKIYFHLWPNAYSDKQSAFAKQNIRIGRTDFHFAPSADMGGIDSLDFASDGRSLNWKLDAEHVDIALVFLAEALEPGERIRISTPFRVRIPGAYSRLSHIETSYQIAQWYPKPAVYDNEGWHAMPYLNMGEFYGEFGSYDVQITLPRNYVVAATGTLQNPEEYDFLESVIAESKRRMDEVSGNGAFPASDPAMKTIRFTAENVHDFAWFADKRFYVEKDKVKVDHGTSVDVWAFYTDAQRDLWANAVSYTQAALRFYSEHVGPYPYPQMSVVQSPQKAGGGMEYPMITVLGDVEDARALDHVIAHEVGHNWFYGILGSNERAHAWMDEGINVYYDMRYFYERYGDDHFSKNLPSFARNKELSLLHYGYLTQAARHADQAPNTPSENLSRLNYPISAYIKPALAFLYLEKYIGRTSFDAAMQAYYNAWKFKHPKPEHVRNVLERTLNTDLSWLFDGFLFSNAYMDYAMAGIDVDADTKVVLRNKGDIAAPVKVSAFQGGEKVYSEWVDGFEGEHTQVLPGSDYDWITLDAEAISLDVDRMNNHIKTKGLFKRSETTRYGFLAGLDDSRYGKRFLIPFLGFNKYDGLMIGVVDYDPLFPPKAFQFDFIPMFGFGSTDFSFLLNARQSWFPKAPGLHKITFGLHSRQFGYARNDAQDTDLRYWLTRPWLSAEWKKTPYAPSSHRLTYRFHYIRQDDPTIDQGLADRFLIHDLRYTFSKKHVLTPLSVSVGLEQQSYKVFSNDDDSERYLKLDAEFKLGYLYQRNKRIDVRVYAARYLNNTKRESNNFSAPFIRGSTPLAFQGFNDYTFEDLFFGRSEQRGIWSQQVSIRGGGFKTAMGSSFPFFGQTNHFLSSVNVETDLPIDLPAFLPIRAFFDAGVFATKMNASDALSNEFLFSGGLMLDVEGVLSIYFPLINSTVINDLYKGMDGGYSRRISFRLDLSKLHPDRLIEDHAY